MSLTARLALSLLLSALVALALSLALRLPRESARYVLDLEREHAAAGKALAAVVEEVWLDDGEARALELLGATRYAGSRVEHQSPLELGRMAPFDDPAAWQRLGRGHAVSHVAPLARAPDDVVTFVPLRPEGRLVGALVIRESLAPRHAHLRDGVIGTLQAALLMALLAPLAAWRVGGRVFGDHRRLDDEVERMSARLASLEQIRHTERLTTVGKLASGVAHELGTPLHVVIARAKRILRREPRGGETARDAESIEREGLRMSRLIRQVLTFSRPGTAHRAPVELSALAREVAALLAPVAEARGVHLETQGDLVVSVDGDHDALAEVLTNLALNALQASPPGGTVTLAVLEPVPDPVDPSRLLARVAVRDQGHGIPNAVRQRIFEPFFTTREVGEGTGLGLSVAWGVVREHGGFIEVWSEEGAGSRFTVHLPLPERTGLVPDRADAP